MLFNTRKMFRADSDIMEGTDWCEVTIELREREEGKLELSICGTAGYTLTPKQARQQALDGWISYFEDDAEAMAQFRRDHRKNTPRTAAKHVLAVDGEYHGLDVHMQEDDKVYCVHSAGQIVETIAAFFPEVEPYLKWHLNGMRAGCEHQRALGWGPGRTVALSPHELTSAQHTTLQALAEVEANKLRAKLIKEARERSSGGLMRLLGRGVTVSEADVWAGRETRHDLSARLLAEVADAAARKIPAVPFAGAIYKDSIGAPCPTCGYRYGTSWLFEKLPTEVIEWARGVNDVAA